MLLFVAFLNLFGTETYRVVVTPIFLLLFRCVHEFGRLRPLSFGVYPDLENITSLPGEFKNSKRN